MIEALVITLIVSPIIMLWVSAEKKCAKLETKLACVKEYVNTYLEEDNDEQH